jgi:hypothetical protein
MWKCSKSTHLSGHAVNSPRTLRKFGLTVAWLVLMPDGGGISWLWRNPGGITRRRRRTRTWVISSWVGPEGNYCWNVKPEWYSINLAQVKKMPH